MHPDQHTYEEAKLLSLLAKDSEYAFQVIYERYRNRIYHTAIRYLKSPMLAQETVQDVFLKLWLERRNIHPAKPIEAWLYTVAKNNLLNRLKRIAIEWKSLHQWQLNAPKTENSASDKVEDSQYSKLLQQALDKLSPQQQKIFFLARQEHLTYIQIGEKLGLSPLTVKTHMARALNHIKTCMAENGETFFCFLIVPLTFF